MRKQLVNPFNRMTDYRRTLMIRVFDWSAPVLPHLYQIENLERCDEVLSWLVDNRITGKTLLEWMKVEHENSLLKTVSFILMKINRDNEPKPIIFGKDWKA